MGTGAAVASTSDSTAQDATRHEFGRRLVDDTSYILTAPARWDATDWERFGIVTAAIVGTGVLFDKRESDGAEDKTNSLDELASKAERFGDGSSVLVLAGFYAGGKLLDSPRATAVGEDGMIATVIASGFITPFVKWTVGRVRPADTNSSTEFRPFGHDHSFPSGHTTQAFAVASVIGAHYESIWIDATAYTIAGLVGYARHQHQAHWPSDIVAGAAIGASVGQTVAKLNDGANGARVSIRISEHGPMAALIVPLR